MQEKYFDARSNLKLPVNNGYTTGKEAWEKVTSFDTGDEFYTVYDHITGIDKSSLWEFSIDRNQAEYEFFYPHINFDGVSLDLIGVGTIPFVGPYWIVNQFFVLLLQKYQCEKLEEMYSE